MQDLLQNKQPYLWGHDDMAIRSTLRRTHLRSQLCCHHRQIGSLTAFFALFILIFGILTTPIMAQGKSSFSNQTPDSVKFTPPPPPNIPDPCKTAWNKIKGKIGKKSFGNDNIRIDPGKMFKSRCDKYKDDLTAWARKPIDDAKAQFDDAKDKVLNAPQRAMDKAEQQLRDGFYAWAAEQMRQRLPPKERDKYSDLNDPATRAKFQEWANDPKNEFGAYVGAYMNENHPALASAYSTYVDLTAGQSKEILDGLRGILNDAKGKLSRFTSTAQEIKADPKAKYKEKLAKAGFTGKWLNKFGSYEGRLRALDRDYNIKAAAETMMDAFQSDVPRDKIKGMFKLMDQLSATAESSNIPIVSLMGTIVQQYAAVATEMLAQIEGLEEALQARAGYCVGTGSPGLENPAAQMLDKRGILACPMALNRDPWQHIYVQQEGPSPGQIHFWTGKNFIDGQANGGGKPAAQEAVKFAEKARSVGYSVPKGMKGYAGIYNVKGGLLPLLDKSRQVINGIERTLGTLRNATFKGGKCSRDKVLEHVGSMTGLDITSFAKELEEKGSDRLTTTYAASFIAESKGFGKSGSARSGAYKTYDDIWAKLQNMQFRFVSGEVRDITKPSAPCPECAGAILDVRLSGGEEVRSCETWKADNNSNFSLYILSQGTTSLSVSAEVKGAKSDAYPAQGNFVRVLIKGKKDEEEQTAECEAARQKILNARSNAARGYVLAAESYLKYAREHNCPDIADEIAQVQNEIDQANAKNDALAQTAAQSCDIGQIDAAIASLTPSSNERAKTNIANLEKVRNVLNTGGSDLEASRQALRAGDIDGATQALDNLDQKLRGISKFTACPELTTALASARSALERLQQVLAQADQSMSQCSSDGISRMIARLEKMDIQNPAISRKLAELKKTETAIDNSRQAYRAAKAAYDGGDSASALSKLAEAESALNTSGPSSCQNIRDRVAQARRKAEDLADLKSDAQNAMASCSPNDIQRLINLATDKNLPIAEKLKIRLVTLKTIRSSFKSADSQYKKGNLSGALASLDKTQNIASYLDQGGKCPELTQRVNTARSGLADLINTINNAEQAMRSCRLADLASFSDKLTARSGNPRVSSVLARLSKARKRCEKEERARRQTAAHDWCKNKYGGGYRASPVRSGGGYGCMPTQATANAWCNANNQGSGWVAVNIKHNGTHGCQLSRRAQRRNATNYCKKRFGRAFVRVVWLKNGRYNCQYRTASPQRRTICPQGYYYDNRTRRCHNAAAAIGQVLQGLQGLTGNRGSTRRTGCPPGQHYSPQLGRCHADSGSNRSRGPWKCPPHLMTRDGRCKIILRNR